MLSTTTDTFESSTRLTSDSSDWNIGAEIIHPNAGNVKSSAKAVLWRIPIFSPAEFFDAAKYVIAKKRNENPNVIGKTEDDAGLCETPLIIAKIKKTTSPQTSIEPKKKFAKRRAIELSLQSGFF